MTTLFFDEEINIPDKEVKGEITEKEMTLAVKLINSMKGKFEPENYKDEYQDNIKKAISDKLKGKSIKGKNKRNRAEVSNLLDALEKSLKS